MITQVSERQRHVQTEYKKGLPWDLCLTKAVCDPTLPGHRGRESVPLHTHLTQPICSTESALLSAQFVWLMVRLFFFSRTQQFPGECGDGQDSEDHGCSAEPLHGVSVFSTTHILLYMQQSAPSCHSSPYFPYLYISFDTF